jgi:hypothetical protein
MKNQVAEIDLSAGTADVTTGWGGTTIKRIAAIALLSLASLSVAHAQVPDCAPGTLSDYEKLDVNGCLIGGKTFSNFQYHQGPDGLPSNAISVTPGTTPETNNPGLLFEAKWASASQSSFVSYTVEVLHGKPISGASLEMQFGEITGTGTVTVLSDLCPEDTKTNQCGTQALELKVVLSADNAKKPVDTVQFTEPQKAIRVVTPLHVTPGAGGSAALDAFMAVFQ